MTFQITKDEIKCLPPHQFDGDIHLAQTIEESEAIIHFIQNEIVLGFDTESRPAFKKGQKFPIALIQISTEQHACLFRVSKMTMIPQLKDILENPSIKKIAQQPSHELKMLKLEHDVKASGFIDIHAMATTLNCTPKRLKSLAAIFLGIQISKSSQTSNWEKKVLSKKQLVYAATDAWVALNVYKKIMNQDLLKEPPQEMHYGAKKN